MNAPRPTRTEPRPPGRKRRVWRGLLIGIIALMVLLALALTWLLRTESGTGFVLARVQSALDGKLGVARYSGTLAGPLQVDDVHYVDPAAGVDLRIGQASVDLDLLALLGARVAISTLTANSIDVALTSTAPDPGKADGGFSLTPPIDIAIDQAAIENATIRQDGQAVLVVDRFDLSGGWTRQGVFAKRLSLHSPDGTVDLHGTLGTTDGYSGNGETTFAWRLGETDLAGVLKSSSDGREARLDLSLTEPTAASAAMTIGQTRTTPWTLRLDVPEFAARKLLPGSDLDALALHLEGSGDRAGGEARATFGVGAHRILLDPFKYAFANGVLTLDAMHLTSPDAPGGLDLRGTVDTAQSPPRAALKADWSEVVLPADLVGQALATRGELAIEGDTATFSARGNLALGPPGKLADIGLDIAGTPEAITLNTVRLKQENGGLEATGTITLQPVPAWQIDATATRFDPSAFFADWPGAVDFVLATSGTQSDAGPSATLGLSQVGGSLRGRPLEGSADLHMQPGYVVDGTLDLRSGGSRISLEGRGGQQTDARVHFDVASLGDWLPAAGGTARGNVHIEGQWPRLDLDGDMSGRDLAWSGLRANSVELVAKVRNLEQPAGALTLKAANVSRGDIHFDTLVLEGDGNRAAHKLSLVADGSPASLRIGLGGGSEDDRWQGRLDTFELDPAGRNLPDFALANPASLRWDGQTFAVGETCLVGSVPARRRAESAPAVSTTDGTTALPKPEPGADGAPAPTAQEVAAESIEPGRPEAQARLCLEGNSASDGRFAATYRLEHLPVRLLVRLASPDSPVRVRGELGGNGNFSRAADGSLGGQAHIVSDQGELFYSGGNQPLLSYTGFAVEAELAGTTTTATVRAALDHDGRIDGQLRLTPAEGDTQAIDGKVSVDLNSLAFLELLSAEITNPKGSLSANYSIAGTLAEPRLDGALTLTGFASEIPAAGLKLHDGALTLRAADAQHFALEGSLASGQGSLSITGEGGLGAGDPMTIKLKGDQFMAADIPAARVILSPDLTIARNSDGYLVTGAVVVPSADVDLARLPGAGASAASPDVVVVDAEKPEPGKPVPLNARVTVSLGDKVKLKGYGFDGTISGDLAVIERPGRTTTGSGTLNAGGTYKAYGQNLKIETGRILFAGTAIDNPGIDIRATRKIEADNVTAGLLVRGTAQLPVLTVFSEPSMEQSEALSYLVTGKPLSSLKSGEGDMLGTAARALGTAGGDLLAKSIGGRLGVDDIGVADNGALGGAAFTVGKYLSPKLYLSYGVGIFEPGEVVTLRYLFSRHWNFEAQNATTGSRAGINYRIER
ncbi:autotransporter secretion inner membrane protein TamB [Dokdonella immobilis]|uniref:Autotransporter secretion inner membrane protein TamB n=1 Tax=Dokdonella immobilis TaxID=578942 RepID=A0A1I4WTS2_9GAMM|nr:autotransporter secretion inner membrane protein TamB [Dokdonella immobilis]